MAYLVATAGRPAVAPVLLSLLLVMTSAGASLAQTAAELPALRLCVVPASGTLYERPTAAAATCRTQHTPTDLLRIPATGLLSASTAVAPLRIANTGTGGALELRGAGGTALFLEHTGNGTGLLIRKPAAGTGLLIEHTGASGTAIHARSGNSHYTSIFESTSSTAGALIARAAGNGVSAAYFESTGTGSSLHATSATALAGYFLGTRQAGPTISVNGTGTGPTGAFENTNTGQAIALLARGHGVWPAAQFENANGLALRTFGGADIRGPLTVVGSTTATGTKSAVVPTTRGFRKVYTEESTEVWFTDYGFGRMTAGVVWVPLDSLFAETVRVDGPYHVFLQGYADGLLFVSRRTATGFEVRAGRGAPADAEFSYRLVARRRGYERERLEALAVEDTIASAAVSRR